MTLYLSIAGIAILALGLAWLTRLAWRRPQPWVKWPATVLAGLLAVLALSATALAALGVYRVNRTYAHAVPDLSVLSDPVVVAEGERLAYLCVDCHSSTGELPLDGAAGNLTDGGMGTLTPPNLTPGGALATWSDGEIVRAIREGVDAGGHTLLLMPSDQYRGMSDEDVQALVSYLRSQPAVARQTPPRSLNLLGAMIVGAGVFPISVQPPVGSVAAPSPADMGEYLVTLAGCGECHGEDLRGGTSQFTPMGPNLLGILAQWEADEFVNTIKTGVDPYGHELNPETMPWQSYAKAFDDAELEAIYHFIRSLPAGGAG